MTDRRRARAGLSVEPTPEVNAKAARPTRRIDVIPREDSPSELSPELSPEVPGRPRTGVRLSAAGRAEERPFERDAFSSAAEGVAPRGGDAPVGVDAPYVAFWPPVRVRTGEGQLDDPDATPPDGALVGALAKHHVRYVSPAWVIAGERSIEGRCDGIGTDGVLLQVPLGLVLPERVLHLSVVVCLALPISAVMVALPCTLVARMRGRPGHETLSCHFSLLRHDVEREIELYVNALASR